MAQPLPLEVFHAVGIVVSTAIHLYVYARLKSYFQPARVASIALSLLVIVGCALTLDTSSLPHQFSAETARPLLWISYSWLGVLIFLMLAFISADVLQAAILLVRRRHPLAAGRRLFLRRALGATAVGGAVVTGGSAVAAGRIVAIKQVEVRLRKLHPELDGFTIVQISDLHVGPLLDRAWLADIVARCNALNPDIIAVTGDLADGRVADLAAQVAPLADLRAPQGVFYITGNHEYYWDGPGWVAHVASLGLTVLHNRRVTITRPGGTAAFDLAGMPDIYGARIEGHVPDYAGTLGNRDMSRPVVLLAHQPVAILKSSKYGVDLQISGHTHGGQIWPWGYFVRLQQPYIKGLHRHPGGESQIYVSEGTGFWGPPMRLGTAAEITRITLRSEA